MMVIALPKVIHSYFAADRGSDPEAVARCFTDTATVRDEGNTYRGRDAIRQWVARSSTEYTYTVEPFAIAAEGDSIVVTGHVVGNFPGSPVDLRYRFGLDGDRIAALEIMP
jgi:ketosteroid isomerase-like protein